MSGDDLITSMQTAVKLEVVEYYFRERCIIEEEIALVFEGTQEYHNKLACWRKDRDSLLTALFKQENIDEFSGLTGLPPFECCILLQIEKLKFRRPIGHVTRWGRYRRLMEQLYRGLHLAASELENRRSELEKLCKEVNADIKHFEMNHDLLAITAYLRSLNAEELQKRKILGVNFTAKEKAAAAAALSFRPINPDNLRLNMGPDPMMEPDEALPKARPLLKKICKNHAKEVDSLFIYD